MVVEFLLLTLFSLSLRITKKLTFLLEFFTTQRHKVSEFGINLVRLQGLEPRAHCLEGNCSIHLSYRRITSQKKLYEHYPHMSIVSLRQKCIAKCPERGGGTSEKRSGICLNAPVR